MRWLAAQVAGIAHLGVVQREMLLGSQPGQLCLRLAAGQLGPTSGEPGLPWPGDPGTDTAISATACAPLPFTSGTATPGALSAASDGGVPSVGPSESTVISEPLLKHSPTLWRKRAAACGLTQ